VDAREKGGRFFNYKMNLRCGAFDGWTNDGRMDVLLTSKWAAPSCSLHNRGASHNHWLTLKLVGTPLNRTDWRAGQVQAARECFQAQGAVPHELRVPTGPRLSISGWDQESKVDLHRDSVAKQRPDAGSSLTYAVFDQILRVREGPDFDFWSLVPRAPPRQSTQTLFRATTSIRAIRFSSRLRS